MKFCIECGTDKIVLNIPSGDNRDRFICMECNYIHYQNPRMICGTVPTYDGKILLCKRDIEPRKGFWTLPAGFMENGESIEEAANRETQEEALGIGENLQLYALFSLPHIHQVHIFFRCDLKNGKFGAGSETCDAKLFAPEDIPWKELSFRTVTQCLKLYLSDLESGNFTIRTETLLPLGRE